VEVRVCKHIMDVSHSGTKMIKGNEEQARRGCFIERDPHLYVPWSIDELGELAQDSREAVPLF